MLRPREDFVKVVPFHLSDRLVIVLCENKPEPQTLDGLVDFKVDKLIWKNLDVWLGWNWWIGIHHIWVNSCKVLLSWVMLDKRKDWLAGQQKWSQRWPWASKNLFGSEWVWKNGSRGALHLKNWLILSLSASKRGLAWFQPIMVSCTMVKVFVTIFVTTHCIAMVQAFVTIFVTMVQAYIIFVWLHVFDFSPLCDFNCILHSYLSPSSQAVLVESKILPFGEISD